MKLKLNLVFLLNILCCFKNIIYIWIIINNLQKNKLYGDYGEKIF